MRRDNINYFLVGLFTLVSLAVLLVALYKITGRVGQAEPYHVYFHNIAGLGKGTHVTYEGYQIGYVERLVPEQDRNTGAPDYRPDGVVRVLGAGELSEEQGAALTDAERRSML